MSAETRCDKRSIQCRLKDGNKHTLLFQTPAEVSEDNTCVCDRRQQEHDGENSCNETSATELAGMQ